MLDSAVPFILLVLPPLADSHLLRFILFYLCVSYPYNYSCTSKEMSHTRSH